MSFSPIGIFDSGVGGLSIARSIRKQLPNENIIYIADSFNAPYGNKTEEFILKRSCYIMDYLINKNAKAIVVACNTATVNTIHRLRDNYSIPIIGVEPGIKPAVAMTKTGSIGVLATEQTINSQSFKSLLKLYGSKVCIHAQGCPGLVELVEAQNLTGEEIRSLLTEYAMPMLAKGADTLVMGCTHFAFLTGILREIVGVKINIINTYQAVAMETSRRLKVNNLLTSRTTAGDVEFLSSNVHGNTPLLFEKLWKDKVTVRKFHTE